MATTKIFLIGFPVFMLVLSILFQGGGLTSSTTPTGGIGSQSNVNFCASGQTGCAPAGSVTVTTCQNALTPCKIAPNCIMPTPSPAWCFPWPFSLIPTNQGTWLSAGQTVVLTANQFNAGLTAQAAIFSFGTIGASGWLVIIIVAIGLISLASITVLNSGMGTEGVHVLFIGGTLLGVWAILSAFEGFIVGSSGSLFSQINQMGVAGVTGFGTIVYVGLTLMYTVGIITYVSRGSV